MDVEWNPHIINKSNLVKNVHPKEDFNTAEKNKKAFIFLEKYNAARELIAQITKSSFPNVAVASADNTLAYRLEPQLSDITDFNKDILAAPKFGGIPDMTWWHSFCKGRSCNFLASTFALKRAGFF